MVVLGEGQGHSFAGRGEDADFEAVAQQDAGAALRSEGFAADGTPIRVGVWKWCCVFFEGFRNLGPIL